MKIKIYFFGKDREVSDWEKTYLKRINFRVPSVLIPLPPAGIKEAEPAQKKEADLFLAKLKPTDFLVAFDEHGEILDSPAFSKWMKVQFERSGEIILVIGGAHGLHPLVLDRANMKISFGKMVWTRNLVRLMALEQIYRALEIAGGSNFHKD